MTTSVSVVGGGHQGLAMAAHLSINGVKCFLWNRTQSHIQEIIDSKRIVCKGIVNGTAQIQGASIDISENLQKLIMVTTPSSAHKDIARLLAPLVDDSYVIVLNPGRTFGALEFVRTLKAEGCKSIPIVAETQTIVYTCRRSSGNTVEIFAMKKNVLISTLNIKQITEVMEVLPICIRKYFIPAHSYIETSLGNVGMILHCAPVLMNVGWIENEGKEFKYYSEGISKSIASILEKLDVERMKIAEGLGYPVESVEQWLKRVYSVQGNGLYEILQNNVYYKDIEAPQTIHHRYIEEDVPNGLVSVESVGTFLHIKTPITSLFIDLANIVMEKDYREIGRKYQNLMSKL